MFGAFCSGLRCLSMSDSRTRVYQIQLSRGLERYPILQAESKGIRNSRNGFSTGLSFILHFSVVTFKTSFMHITNNWHKHYSLEEVTGDLALEVPQWFIVVLISPDPTFYKTNGCQAGTLEPFEKSKMAAKIATKKTEK